MKWGEKGRKCPSCSEQDNKKKPGRSRAGSLFHHRYAEQEVVGHIVGEEAVHILDHEGDLAFFPVEAEGLGQVGVALVVLVAVRVDVRQGVPGAQLLGGVVDEVHVAGDGAAAFGHFGRDVRVGVTHPEERRIGLGVLLPFGRFYLIITAIDLRSLIECELGAGDGAHQRGQQQNDCFLHSCKVFGKTVQSYTNSFTKRIPD